MRFKFSIALCAALMVLSGCNDSTKDIKSINDNTKRDSVKLDSTGSKISFNNTAQKVSTDSQKNKAPQFISKTQTLAPANLAPVCKIKVSSNSIHVNDTIHFSASESYDQDGNIVAYKWEDMDGNVLSESSEFDREFIYPAKYIKTLYVTDDKGKTSKCSVNIAVLGYTHKALTTNFIHINDHHSHLSSENRSLYFNGKKTYVQMGGFPRVVTKIKELQETKENPITLHAGDMIQGTLYYTIFKSQADIDMMKQIKWDAITIGNHEFDDGDAELKKIIDGLNGIPFVSANVFAQPGSLLANMWKPYTIVERDGEKIGIVGLVTGQKTKVSSRPSDQIVFLDEVLSAQKSIDDLKALGINKIVLLSHNGMKHDLDIASKLTDIDVVIDGDSHSLLGDFSMVGLKSAYAKYPEEVTSANGDKVCVASAWQYAYAVGDLEVDFDEAGKVTSCKGQTTLLLGDSFKQKDTKGKKVDVNSTEFVNIMKVIDSTPQLEIVEQDQDTLAKLKKYSDQIDAKKAEVVGNAAEFLGHNRIPGDKKDGVSDLALGSDIAPLVAKSFYLKSARADACIQNAGGVRIAIDQGPIDIEEAYTLLPFSNTLYELDMTGAEIKQVLEDAITNFKDNGGSTGSFPYAYGLRYDVDLTQPKNNRISNLEIMKRTDKSWSAIDNAKTYVIVTNDYIAAGRDGYTTFKTVQDTRGEGVNTYYDYAMSFVDMVKGLYAKGKELTKLPAEEHPIKSFKQ